MEKLENPAKIIGTSKIIHKNNIQPVHSVDNSVDNLGITQEIRGQEWDNICKAVYNIEG